MLSTLCYIHPTEHRAAIRDYNYEDNLKEHSWFFQAEIKRCYNNIKTMHINKNGTETWRGNEASYHIKVVDCRQSSFYFCYCCDLFVQKMKVRDNKENCYWMVSGFLSSPEVPQASLPLLWMRQTAEIFLSLPQPRSPGWTPTRSQCVPFHSVWQALLSNYFNTKFGNKDNKAYTLLRVRCKSSGAERGHGIKQRAGTFIEGKQNGQREVVWINTVRWVSGPSMGLAT